MSHIFLDHVYGKDLVTRHRRALLSFSGRMQGLPIALVTGMQILTRTAETLPKAAFRLKLDKLRNEAQDVPGLLQQAIDTQDKQCRLLLQACAMCSSAGFWLPLAFKIAGLTEREGEEYRDQLVNSSLLRMVSRDRQRFELHALLRTQLKRFLLTANIGSNVSNTLKSTKTISKLRWFQGRHARALEELFEGWEHGWKKCRECFDDLMQALVFLRSQKAEERMSHLTSCGFWAAYRVGEFDLALRALNIEEDYWKGRRTKQAKRSLARLFGNRALVLKHRGRLKEAMRLHKKEEAFSVQIANIDQLQKSYGNQAVLLRRRGKLTAAMRLHKKEEAICLKLGDKSALQACLCNQAIVLQMLGRFEDALRLHKRDEALSEAHQNKNALQICYNHQARILRRLGRLDEAHKLHNLEEEMRVDIRKPKRLTRFPTVTKRL